MRNEIAKTLKRLALGGALAAVATNGFAVTQGTVGFTSTGDVDITLTVNDEVNITNLADILLPAFAGADVSGTSPACIYRNGGATYQVTATGSGPANAFQLINAGLTDTVNYSVTWDDGTGALPMTSGLAVNRTNAVNVDNNCAGVGNNAQIEVTVTAADASVLPADSYLGTLYFLVAPI